MASVLVSPPLLVRSLLCTRDRKQDSGRPSKQNGMKKPSCRWALPDSGAHSVLTGDCLLSSWFCFLWVASFLDSTHPSPLAVPTLHLISLATTLARVDSSLSMLAKTPSTPFLEKVGPKATPQLLPVVRNMFIVPLNTGGRRLRVLCSPGLVSTRQLGQQIWVGWEPVFLQAFR